MVELLKFDDALWQRVVSLLEYDPTSPLTLATGFFLFAFLIFALGYVIIKRRAKLRTWYVTLFSLYFYYKLSGVYIILLCAVALSDYLIGKRVAHRRYKGLSTRGWVALSVVINVAILTYFKATGFFADLLANIYKDGVLNFEGVVVPAGVSFFVFQSIAYVVDIARGTIKPLRRFIDYLFLLSFFPKMFLGPLVKAKEFIPQIEARDNNVTREDFGRAVTLIAGGLIKYAVIASSLGALFVNPAFKGELGDSGVVALLAIYGFTLQIYCDFSGYSDIAVGVALMMGFRLPDNFDAPYKSATITEFWRRWHISLSTWLKEYLYIALGGNRRGAVRTYINLFLTMVLGGLWHGVGICYMAWGMLHGIALALHKMWLKVIPWAKKTGKEMYALVRIPATLITLHVVAFGWLLFASAQQAPKMGVEDYTLCLDMINRIATNFSFGDIIPAIDNSGVAMAIMYVGYVLHFLPKSFNTAMQRMVTRSGFVGQWLLMVAVIWIVMQSSAMLMAETGVAAGLPMYADY
ncbi:MAG: MBOAT family protein [Alistipes sp.]|nr:MBOAT family protein [Alistipes sp.]